MFILRETFTAIRRTPFMSAMTAFVIAIALAVIGVFGIIIIRAHDALTEFRSKLVMEAFFETRLLSGDAKIIAETNLKPLDGITSYRFISREEALEDYEKRSGENVVEAVGFNPLPASVRMTIMNLNSETAKKLEQSISHIDGIAKVVVDHVALDALEARQRGLITLGAGMGGLLLLAALAIAAATIRIAMHARRDAVRAMRLLGASRTTIVAPFILEGMFAGFAGSVLGIALSHAIITYGLPMLMPEMDVTLSLRQEYIVLAGGIVLTGVALAFIGSALTAFALFRRSR